MEYAKVKSWTVYVHITPSCKYYVGVTSQPLNRRWRNGKGYISSTYFNQAIKKYGWENISHEVVASALTEDEAKKFEMVLIEKLNSNNRDFGYNLTNGGDGVTGYSCPDEKKNLLSKSMSGKGNPMYGIKLEGMKGEDNPMFGKPAHNRKIIMCTTTGEIFDTVGDGAKKYKTYRSDINKSVDGRRSYAGKSNGIPLKWRYLDDNSRD